MSESQRNSLFLNTGELQRETLRIVKQKTASGIASLKVKISFPVFNPGTKENFWLWAETLVDLETCADLADFLDNWTDPTDTFKTGHDKDQSISFMDDQIKSENCAGKKMRILIPAFGFIKQKTAITKLNLANAESIINFIDDFLQEEGYLDDEDDEDGDREEKVVEIERLRQVIEDAEKTLAELLGKPAPKRQTALCIEPDKIKVS